MGDVQQMGIQTVSVQALQGLGDLQMDTLAPRHTWISVEHMPDQWVRELKAWPIVQEYTLVHAFFQQSQQLLFAMTAQRP
jgi:hypothetical protein